MGQGVREQGSRSDEAKKKRVQTIFVCVPNMPERANSKKKKKVFAF
jgi:hypothetical protein